MRRIVIGVMGAGDKASRKDRDHAFHLGQLIASQGWILLTGGRSEGVMDAASKGAKSADGLTIGIIPTANNASTSKSVDIAIVTGMGSARNNINVLSSDIVIACGLGAGTASEIALALKANKDVILLAQDVTTNTFFTKLAKEHVFIADTPDQAIELAKSLLSQHINDSAESRKS